MQYEGPLPGRQRDVIGVGGYAAMVSGRLRSADGGAFARKVGVEAYYRVEVLCCLAG